MNNGLKRILASILLIAIECFVFRIAQDNSVICSLLIIINAPIVGVCLLKNKSGKQKKMNYIIFFSFIIRTIMLFLDINGYSLFSGSDANAFYSAALEHGNTIFNYSIFLKGLILFVGNSRLVLQYFNVIVSLFYLLIFKRIILTYLEKEDKKSIIGLIILAFSPIGIMLSSALLRESIMIFLNIVSLFYFLKWYKNGKNTDFIISCIFIALSSWFHSGMIAGLFAYILLYILYDKKAKKIAFRKNTFFAICFALMIIFGIFAVFGDSLTSYFNRVSSIEDIGISRSTGSSDYLIFLKNNTNPVVIIATIPLKIIYFYLSPMIWDCKTFEMLLVFVFSSTIYIYLFYSIIRVKHLDKTMKIFLIIMLLFLSITYALGVGNTGTAMRHREKILPFIILLYIVRRKNLKEDTIIPRSRYIE